MKGAMNTAQYLGINGKTAKYGQVQISYSHQLKSHHHIQPCITIRPNKMHQNLSLSIQNSSSIQKSNRQILNLSIPKNSQPDMLWKTEMSQSFVEKLEIFEDQEPLAIQNLGNTCLNKFNFENRIGLVKGQVLNFKEFANEVKENITKMHKVYSEGNRKSIELVMLIVKKLENQNSILKQKLSSMSSLHLSQSTNSVQSKDFMVQAEPINGDQRDLIGLKSQSESIQDTKIQKSDRPSEKQTQQCPNIDQQNDMEASPVWSVLLGQYQLETIQELEHDDSTCSLHSNKINPFYDGPNTFSSKLDVTDRVSAPNQSHVQSFNFEEVTNLFSLNHKDGTKQKEQKNFSDSKKIEKVQEESKSICKENENLSKDMSFQEDEQQSLIVKKLLKLNKISHRRNSLSLKSSIPCLTIQNNQAKQNSKPNLNQVFASISIPTISQKENPHSISEALTILKEYNGNDSKHPVTLEQSQKQNQKQLKPKGPGKISLYANKKVQNKENIPDSQHI